MAGRGVLFALTEDSERSLLAARSDEQVMALVEEIEDEWDIDELAETDKAWDAIHRCLTDGTLQLENGAYPLNKCIVGGRQLYSDEDYIVSYKTSNEARDVASALISIGRDELQLAYFDLKPPDFPSEYLTDKEFEYTWEYFMEVKRFYSDTAKKNRAVIFTVDI